MLPTADAWSYAAIQREDESRVALLESTGSGEDLVEILAAALAAAFEGGLVRYGIDFHGENPRVTIQFSVAPSVYDWFYNGRAGYRAHFWMSPERGERYNLEMLTALKSALEKHLPEAIVGRKIGVDITNDVSREETDQGSIDISRTLVGRSLDAEISKIWLCERLIQTDGNKPCDLLPFYLAERCLPKLIIPRWLNAIDPKTGDFVSEGLRAPYPEKKKSWLDIKGGFVEAARVYQLKSPHHRAVCLNRCGWT